MQRHDRSSTYKGASPWTFPEQVVILLWHFAWPVLCGWTPKPLNAWRLLVLRLFGATIRGRPFVHQRARIQCPWRITLHDRACVGDRANLYSIDRITLEEGSLAAQEAYLCAGTHDFRDPTWPLLTAPIVVRRNAFIGARAFILPGRTIGEGAIVGACSVVTKDVAAGTTVVGNPALPALPRRQ